MANRVAQRIGILGAGLPGLATAHALHQVGFRHISVFEASGSFGDAAKALHAGGVVLAANGVRVLDRLGLAAPLYHFGQQIHAVNNLSHAGHYLNGYSPSALVSARARSADVAPGESTQPQITNIAIHGRHLYDALSSTLPKSVNVHFNAPLSKVERKNQEEVHSELVLRAGNGGAIEFDADLLVGDDGIHSRLRDEVMPAVARGPSVERLNGIYVRGVAPASALKPFEGTVDRTVLSEIWGNGCKLSYAFIDEHTVMWLATISTSLARALPQQASDAGMPAALAKIFASCPPYVASLLSAAVPASLSSAPVEQRGPAGMLHDATSGRIVLVGAAAHSPVQENWQALAQGLEDAAVLATLLERLERPAALEHYSRLRVPRASFVGRAAASETQQALQGGRIMSAFRDMATSYLPQAATREAMAQILAYDAIKDAQGAA